jgi:hypothetical protein
VRLGFIDFVGKASTGPRLFPHWKRGEDGYYSSVFSKWFGRFLTSVDLKDPRLVFHSFRHGFKDALRRAMVEERIQDAIMGHEPEHVSSDYGLGYAPTELSKAIKAVTYPGLDLTSLHPSRPRPGRCAAPDQSAKYRSNSPGIGMGRCRIPLSTKSSYARTRAILPP